ncbi:hypothetical protein [Aquimarina litoralis]|uniref:hypothetical protein n=1 Tax=Aquimarina litoralis TaxID=584605 RepID=UPI001C588AC1|nr:hypothetical protein [Aquimarina litoralis]MBW1297821.1 hypothetical protein [Aquimarina litoralis]
MEKTEQKVSTIHQNDVATIQANDIVSITTNDINADLHVIKTNEKIIYKAIDNSKPFYVEGKKYQNVVVERKFIKEVDSSKIKDNSIAEAIDNTIIETKDQSFKKEESEQKEKKVHVERNNSFGFWDWLLLLLAVVTVFFLVFKHKSIYGYVLTLFKKVVV